MGVRLGGEAGGHRVRVRVHCGAVGEGGVRPWPPFLSSAGVSAVAPGPAWEGAPACGGHVPGLGLPPRWFSGTCVYVHVYMCTCVGVRVHCVCACASVCLCVHACVCVHIHQKQGVSKYGERRGPGGLGGGARCLLHCSCDLLKFRRSGWDENVCCALGPGDRGLEAVTHGPVTAQQVPLCLPGASGGSLWVWL